MMLDPHFKGLGLVIQCVGKEKADLIAGEYDRYVLFPLLIHAYKFLNPFATNETVATSTTIDSEVNNFKVKTLYDLMETNEKMASLMVKEQLNHYRISKVSDEECKSLFAWWKAHESQFSYVAFVAQQILGIVGSQFEVERVFNIVDICTNM